MKTKALTEEQNEALRAITREVVEREFGGKVSVAAAKQPHKISHSLLFEFLDHRRGAGMKLLEWISARTGRGIDDLLGRPASRVERGGSSHPAYRNLARWSEAVAAAMKRWPWIARYPRLIEAAGDGNALFVTGAATPEMVLGMVQQLLEHGDPDLVEQAEAERVDREIEADEARHGKALLLQKEMLERGDKPPSVESLMRELERTEAKAARGARAGKADNDTPPKPSNDAKPGRPRKAGKKPGGKE